jgi:hypothetical protein
MTIFQWILLAGFSIFLLSFVFVILRSIIKKGAADYSEKRGSEKAAVFYSFTGAMSPKKKESAHLHLPTYTAGLFFHIGTFFCFFWLILFFFNVNFGAWFHWVSFCGLIVTGAMGFSILIKRMALHKLRSMSNPDDYFSNLLVTGFHLFSAIAVLWSSAIDPLFIYATFLFIYIPLGKLKHVFYFFPSRIFLGKFYGKRGVWPVR